MVINVCRGGCSGGFRRRRPWASRLDRGRIAYRPLGNEKAEEAEESYCGEGGLSMRTVKEDERMVSRRCINAERRSAQVLETHQISAIGRAPWRLNEPLGPHRGSTA